MKKRKSEEKTKDTVIYFMALAIIMLLTWFCLFDYNQSQEIRSLQHIVSHLQAKERPLILVNGKYPYLAVNKDELIIKGVKKKVLKK